MRRCTRESVLRDANSLTPSIGLCTSTSASARPLLSMNPFSHSLHPPTTTSCRISVVTNIPLTFPLMTARTNPSYFFQPQSIPEKGETPSELNIQSLSLILRLLFNVSFLCFRFIYVFSCGFGRSYERIERCIGCR